jgi:hypothetical protein
MKHLGGIVAAVIVIGAAVAGPAAAAAPSAASPVAAVSTAKTAAVEAVPTDTKLNPTQLSNFVIAYCLNVAAHGADTTKNLFAEVVQQDGISSAQASYIQTVAGATC